MADKKNSTKINIVETQPDESTESEEAKIVLPKRNVLGIDNNISDASVETKKDTPTKNYVANKPLIIKPLKENLKEKTDHDLESDNLAETQEPVDSKENSLTEVQKATEADVNNKKTKTKVSTEPDKQSEEGDKNPELDNDTKPNDEEVEDQIFLKRQTELEDIIDAKKYNVPINSVQKRSTKTSLLLLLVVIILAIILLDLLLDTGIILLLQKVPHTHFFSN